VKVSQLGEFGLIKAIKDIVEQSQHMASSSGQKILLGIGDDAAAWQSNQHIALVTTDTLVQDVHFDLKAVTWEELGWKALAVNLSDIAAMGGIPTYALLSLALPPQLDVDDIIRFVRSMIYLANQFDVILIGGNTVAAPQVVINMTLIGYCKTNAMLRRTGALPGEQISVTGYLGSSAAGLAMLKGKFIRDREASNFLRQAHLKPTPRIREGQILLQQGVRTAIDISDGLVADLEHICEASGVSAKIRVDQLPVHPVVKTNFPDFQQLALFGGEDYELLFTADQETISRVRQSLACPITVIGEVTREISAQRVMVIDDRGNILRYEKGGWNHFRNAATTGKFTQP
jgi:thiamine-monophosphate kinase